MSAVQASVAPLAPEAQQALASLRETLWRAARKKEENG